MNKFDKARQFYRPSAIKYLFIAETPPKADSSRFFYFENVMEKDSLFIETVKVLYPVETLNIDTYKIRLNKKHLLERFRDDGYYLVDSLQEPFEQKYSPSQKVRLITNGQEDLLKSLKQIIDAKTKVILISATVYRANYLFLKQKGINVINKEMIDFPGSGGQKKFREKLNNLIA